MEKCILSGVSEMGEQDCGVQVDPDDPSSWIGTGFLKTSFSERHGAWRYVYQLDFRSGPGADVSVELKEVFCQGQLLGKDVCN